MGGKRHGNFMFSITNFLLKHFWCERITKTIFWHDNFDETHFKFSIFRAKYQSIETDSWIGGFARNRKTLVNPGDRDRLTVSSWLCFATLPPYWAPLSRAYCPNRSRSALESTRGGERVLLQSTDRSPGDYYSTCTFCIVLFEGATYPGMSQLRTIEFGSKKWSVLKNRPQRCPRGAWKVRQLLFIPRILNVSQLQVRGIGVCFLFCLICFSFILVSIATLFVDSSTIFAGL